MSPPRGQITFPRTSAAGRLDQDLPCHECGYNLRTLLEDGRCPECGAGVHDSVLKHTWLCRQGPEWLLAMDIAVSLALLAMACFLGWLLSVLLRDLGGRWYSWGEVEPFDSIVATPSVIFWFSAVWLATSPRRDDDGGWLGTRRVSRWTTGSALASALTFLLIAKFDPFAWPALLLLGLCTIGLLGVGTWSTLTYLVGLAQRASGARLAMQVRIVGWGSVACALSILICTLVEILPQYLADQSGDLPSLIRPIQPIAIVLLVVLMLWAIPLLMWCRRRFRHAAVMSQG